MYAIPLFGMQMPTLFAMFEAQDFVVGFLIFASTVAYLIWLIKRKL
jgi:hypothetical protein